MKQALKRLPGITCIKARPWHFLPVLLIRMILNS